MDPLPIQTNFSFLSEVTSQLKYVDSGKTSSEYIFNKAYSDEMRRSQASTEFLLLGLIRIHLKDYYIEFHLYVACVQLLKKR